MMLKNFIYPKTQVHRTIPANLDKKDEQLFNVELEKTFDTIKSQQHTKVFVLSNGVVIKYKILAHLFYERLKISYTRLLKLYIKSLICLMKSKQTIKIENALLLTDNNCGGFFHWFGDVLQKLEALDKYNIDISQYTLLIPSTCDYSYMEESLKLYNINYKIIEESKRVYVKNLFVIPQITPSGNYRSELMNTMRSRFSDHYKVPPKNQRIYISRAKAAKRTIVNEDELIPLLQKYNFQIVAMEDLTFEEQYKLIAESDMLISLHGAGLTHMLWMHEDSQILEIRALNDHMNNCYFSLASDLRLKYYYTLAKKTDENATTQQSDFMVDLKDIEYQINSIVQEDMHLNKERS